MISWQRRWRTFSSPAFWYSLIIQIVAFSLSAQWHSPLNWICILENRDVIYVFEFFPNRCPSWCDRVLLTHDTKDIILVITAPRTFKFSFYLYLPRCASSVVPRVSSTLSGGSTVDVGWGCQHCLYGDMYSQCMSRGSPTQHRLSGST